MVDAGLSQCLVHPGVGRVPRILGAAPKEEELQLLVYGGRALDESGHLFLDVEIFHAESAGAEFTHPREFVSVSQPECKRLAASHGKSHDGAVFPIGRDPVVLLDQREHVAE